MNMARTENACSIAYLLSREAGKFITYYDIINIHSSLREE